MAVPIASPSALANGLDRLGGGIDVDGRVSWFAPGVRGESPANCYLLRSSTDAFLVDTGLPIHQESVLAQLRTLLPDGLPLSVLPTRPVEFDSIGNMGAVLEAFPVRRVWSDMPMEGLAGWQARFEPPAEETDASWPPDAGVEFVQFPEFVELDAGGASPRVIEVIRPELRMLMTAWLYDPESRTLFTSDMFSHVLAPRRGAWQLAEHDDDETTPDEVAAHHLAKHHWLAGADGDRLAGEVEAIFAAREVETIAPTFGCVLRGRSVVERHLALLAAALRRFSIAGGN